MPLLLLFQTHTFCFFQKWLFSPHSCPWESLVELRPTRRPCSYYQTLLPDTRDLSPSLHPFILLVPALLPPWAPPPAPCATVRPSNPPHGQSPALTNRIRSPRSLAPPARPGNICGSSCSSTSPFSPWVFISCAKVCSALWTSVNSFTRLCQVHLKINNTTKVKICLRCPNPRLI